MQVIVSQTVQDYEGKNIKTETGEYLTLRDVFTNALNAQIEGEVMSPEDKAKIFRLSMLIYPNKEVELTVDEAAFIKERVGKAYGPLIYGRVCEFLDETSPKKE